MTQPLIPRLINAYLPVIAWTAFIFFLSNQPQLPGPELFTWDYLFKKCAHIFVYFVLFQLTVRAFFIHAQKKSHLQVRWAILFAIIYAMTDEFHQSFVPGRTATTRDFFYDSLGIMISWLYLYRYI